jgi:pimeloyl-ACP methyl ester carboxylesterase
MKTTQKNKRTIAGTIITGAGFLVMFAASSFAQTAPTTNSANSELIRPFHVHVEDAAIKDLRKRIAATRWPDKETVSDQSQGVQLDKIQALVHYWGTDYDWRKAEAKLNALPQFITNIDGVDIQFTWVRSHNPNAMPLIITHGWPGSVFELIKVVGPLTDPAAYGGSADQSFDLVLPSMPGYGFSGRPTTTGWGPDHIAKAWDVLMKRLGYKHYVAQGGDWGSVVADAMARQKPEGLIGIHVNMPATVPADVATALKNGEPAPSGLSWTYSGGDAEKVLSKDDMLDDISLYWFTNTAASSARLYWENNNNNFNAVEQKTADISIPVAVTVFPGEIYKAPRSWTERSYHDLIYFHEADNGGHFAAWEQPQLFAVEMRAAFKTLR